MSLIAVQLLTAKALTNETTVCLFVASKSSDESFTLSLPEASLIAILLAVGAEVAPCTPVVADVCEFKTLLTLLSPVSVYALLAISLFAEGFATCALPVASLIIILFAVAVETAPCTPVVALICSLKFFCILSGILDGSDFSPVTVISFVPWKVPSNTSYLVGSISSILIS